MHLTFTAGRPIDREVDVPGDKSIAHRWVLLAATADGSSELRGVPRSLDVGSTVGALASLTRGTTRAALDGWRGRPGARREGDGSTANNARPRAADLRLEARGRRAIEGSETPLDCGNSGTTIRLLAGVVASMPLATVLTGDASLTRRPMERVAEPLRRMGATVTTTRGAPPLSILGGPLHGIRFEPDTPSAQVKSCILLAGIDAEGETVVVEPAATRDHTERALATLGGPVEREGTIVRVRGFQHGGFEASVPGDLSSAVFLVVAAALGGAPLVVLDVGLNPSRTAVLEVIARMGVETRLLPDHVELGEPVGALEVLGRTGDLRGTSVARDELPLLIDEVPALAMLAAHASGETSFRGAAELRVKESDRLAAIVTAIRSLGGHAAVEGDDLLVAGGGIEGGVMVSGGDHRLAMAGAVAAAGARASVTVEDMQAADVSFPGFVETVERLGLQVGGR